MIACGSNPVPLRYEATTMKYFNDCYALKNLISRISEGVPPDNQVKVLTDLLVDQLGFTVGNASEYATVVLRHRQPSSAECICANALKLVGNWLGIDQSGVVGGYLDSTSYKWAFSQDLTFQYRKQGNRSYSSPFGSNLSSNTSDGFAGVWAPNDASGDEFEVVTIDTDNSLRKLSVNWLDKAVPHKPRSCRLNFRDYARQ
jgi:hypothetical protein